jgi:hypothetical protein
MNSKNNRNKQSANQPIFLQCTRNAHRKPTIHTMSAAGTTSGTSVTSVTSATVTTLVSIGVFIAIITIIRVIYYVIHPPRSRGQECMCDSGLRCIETSSGAKYCIRETMPDGTPRTKEKMAQVAAQLDEISTACSSLVSHLSKNKPDDMRTIRLIDKWDPTSICETGIGSTLTAYNESKGRTMAFCTSQTSDSDDSVNSHTLIFVALHELAHSATVSDQHTDEYWSNFAFLLEEAKAAGIHHPVDYSSSPAQYCGAPIQSNPVFSR